MSLSLLALVFSSTFYGAAATSSSLHEDDSKEGQDFNALDALRTLEGTTTSPDEELYQNTTSLGNGDGFTIGKSRPLGQVPRPSRDGVGQIKLQDEAGEEAPSAPQVDTKFRSSSTTRSINEGVSNSGPPGFYSLNGQNGLQLPLSLPADKEFDFTIMFWFRSHKSLDQISYDTNKDSFLFEVSGGMACFIRNGETVTCTPEQTEGENAGAAFSIPLRALPDIQSWMHITVTAYEKRFAKEAYSSLRIDFPGGHLEIEGGYAPISSNQIFLGIDRRLTTGFDGDVREIFVSLYTMDDPSDAPFLINQQNVWDVSTMGYYRFQEKNDFSDNFRAQTGKMVWVPQLDYHKSQKTPEWNLENISNPFCDSLDHFETLPHFSNYYNPVRVPMSSNTSPQNDFGYTLSMWVNNKGGHSYTTNPLEGRDKHHFFELEEAFALWFDSPHSFRVYIYANKNYFEQSTPSVFLPLHQWANIQITLHQETGVTIMVFNTNGERQQVVTYGEFLHEMRPTGRFIPLNNFNGMIKSLRVWEKFIQTPISHNDDLNSQIISYDFAKDNFVEEETEIGFSGWESGIPGGQRLLGKVNDGFTFHTVKVPDVDSVDYKETASIGQLHANDTQWDGVACDQKEDSLVKLAGQGASLSLNQTFDVTNAFTVELWFRFDENSTAKLGDQNVTYLFTLNKGDSEAMTIFIDDDGLLKCAPFGRKTADLETILTYGEIKPASTFNWQHVSCVYKQSKYIRGEYLSYVAVDQVEDKVVFTEQSSEEKLRAKTFSKSLVSVKERNLNYVTERRWQVVLGNDHSSTLVQDAYFKDLRVWTIGRSQADLYTYRFKQAPLSSRLVTNLKLMDGSPVVYNYDFARVGRSDYKQLVSSRGMLLMPRDNTSIICGSESFFVPSVSMCTSFPFQENLPFWYYSIDNVLHGHKAVITQKFARSALMLPGKAHSPQMGFHWRTNDKPVDELYVQERREVEELELDPIYMGDDLDYTFRVTLHDTKNHQFYQDLEQTLSPRKCLLVVDDVTQESVNSVVRSKIGNPVATEEGAAEATPEPAKFEDLCFNFQVKRVEGCEDNFYDQLQAEIKKETQPPMSPAFLEQAQVAYNPNENEYQVCFGREALDAGILLTNREVNFIFTLFWKSSRSPETSYMSVVYSVLYIETIRAELSVSADKIDVEETLIIDAGNSFYVDTRSKDGLHFRWNCPDVFQNWCNQFEGVSLLEIPPNAFRSYGGKVKESYSFEVQVSCIQAGVGPLSDSQVFKANKSVQWMSLAPPDFNIIMISSRDQEEVNAEGSEQRVLTSIENVAKIEMINYRTTDDYLSIEWTVDPPVEDVVMSADNSAIVFKEGTLNTNVEYTLQVTAHNTQVESAVTSKEFKFTTGTPPTEGSVEITPSSGIMFETQFQIQLNAWASNSPPLKYTLYGVTSKEPMTRIKLTSDYTGFTSEGSASETRSLPMLIALQVEVTDAFGEIVTKELPVVVASKDAVTDWQTIIEQVRTQQDSDMEMKFQYLAFVAFGMNKHAVDKDIKIENAIEGNFEIVSEITSDLNKLNSNDASGKTQGVLAQMTSAIAQATMYEYTLDFDTATMAYESLEKISTKVSAYEENLKDYDFQESYALALANLLEFGAMKAEQETELIQTGSETQVEVEDAAETDAEAAEEDASQRRLQSLGEVNDLAMAKSEDLVKYRSLIHKTIVQKNKLLDSLCHTLNRLGQERRVSTPSMDLVVHKIQATQPGLNQDLQYVDLEDGTTVIVPSDELILQTIDTDPSTEFVCIQTTFLSVNPLAGYTFPQQITSKDMFVQSSTIDSKGRRITQSENGLSGLELAPFEIHFQYDGFLSADFYNNQTVCMAFNGNLQVYEGERWATNSCTTTYNMDMLDGNAESVDESGEEIIPLGTGTIVCRCESMKNHYFAVITDFSRDLIYDQTFTLDFNYILLAVLVPLFIIGIILPCVVLKLDKNDYDMIEKDFPDVPDALIASFTIARKASCEQEVYYKMREIESHLALTHFTPGSWVALKAYYRNLHPLLSLFYKFDFGIKRFSRLAMLIFSVSIITLLSLFVFQMDLEQDVVEEGFFSARSQTILITSAVMGIFMLPWPQIILDKVHTKLHINKLSKNSRQQTPEKDTTPDSGPNNLFSRTQPTGGGLQEDDKQTQGVTNQDVEFSDRCMTVKFIFYVFTYVFYFAIVVLVILFLIFGRQDRADMQWFRMSPENALAFVITWWLSIVVFGWIIYNEIRLVIISVVAPNIAEYYMKNKEAEIHRSFCSWSFIPLESVHIALDALYVIELNPNLQQVGTTEEEQNDDTKKPASQTLPQAQSDVQDFGLGGDDGEEDRRGSGDSAMQPQSYRNNGGSPPDANQQPQNNYAGGDLGDDRNVNNFQVDSQASQPMSARFQHDQSQDPALNSPIQQPVRRNHNSDGQNLNPIKPRSSKLILPNNVQIENQDESAVNDGVEDDSHAFSSKKNKKEKKQKKHKKDGKKSKKHRKDKAAEYDDGEEL